MEHKIETDVLIWATGKVKGFCSKELINQETGSFKLIKIDPHSTYPEHVHPDKIEYVFVMEGNPEFVIDTALHKSKPGDFFIFPQKVKHTISNRYDDDCIILAGSLKNTEVELTMARKRPHL